MLRRLLKLFGNQYGFTLTELLIVIAISALISAGVGTTIYQIFVVNSKSNSHMTAVKEVENAVHWLTRDAQMAQFNENASANGTQASPRAFPLELTWNNIYDNPAVSVNVTYSINGNRLERHYTDNQSVSNTAVVARFINPAGTNWWYSGAWYGNDLIFNVTANVTGYRPAGETRNFQVVTRSVQ